MGTTLFGGKSYPEGVGRNAGTGVIRQNGWSETLLRDGWNSKGDARGRVPSHPLPYALRGISTV